MSGPMHTASALTASLVALALASAAQAQQCCPCDWNADGRLDCDDPTLFIDQWNTDRCSGTHLADFNGDGVVDGRDLVAFTNCFNAGNAGCASDPPPANDHCADATVLVGTGLFPFQMCRASDTTGEGTGPGPTCGLPGLCSCGGPFCDRFMRFDVWFLWTAPSDGTVTLSTAGLAGGADTAIAVYLGPALCQAWSSVAYFSDTGPLGEEAEVSFPAVGGQSYVIQLGTGPGAWSGSGCAPLGLPSALGWHGQLSIALGVVCPDWDGNGVTNSTDVSAFINDWFQDQVDGTLVTDINGDGVSNSTDVSDFINAYFAAPPKCTG
jgi:hypothetical protein